MEEKGWINNQLLRCFPGYPLHSHSTYKNIICHTSPFPNCPRFCPDWVPLGQVHISKHSGNKSVVKVAGAPPPSPLCAFQICLPVDFIWPWTKCPQWFDAFTSWVSSHRATMQHKIAFWQCSPRLGWQESPRDSGPEAWAQTDGTVLPFRCRTYLFCTAALPTRAWKLSGDGNTDPPLGAQSVNEPS